MRFFVSLQASKKNNFKLETNVMKKLQLILLCLPMFFYGQFPEDFETSVPPAGWVLYAGANSLGVVNDWGSTSTSASGTQAAYIQGESVVGGLAEDWLVTLQFTPAHGTSMINFMQKRDNLTVLNPSSYTVRVSDNSQTTHTDFVILDTQSEGDFNHTYSLKQIDISAYIGIPIYVAFVMESNDGNGWYIDDIDLSSAFTYVPDDHFENYLEASGMGDGILFNDYVLTANINTEATLDVSNETISDLTGIEDFTDLQILRCEFNNLTSLNLSSNTALQQLHCYNNILTSLDVSTNTALTLLYCYDNDLTTLDVSTNTSLTALKVQGNDLTTLDIITNTQLTDLICSTNDLVSLDLRNSNNTNLVAFSAAGNPDLFCIDVDDEVWSTNNWTATASVPNIDSWAGFSADCATSEGCTDTAACNYNGTIVIDDGSCTYDNIGNSVKDTCDTYTWVEAGNMLISATGIYTYTFTNQDGCDSVHTLVATIGYSNIGTSIVDACDEYVWVEAANMLITTSGSYDQTFINASGCDSVHTLVVTIVGVENTGTSTVEVCDTYTWVEAGNMLISATGIYTYTFTNQNGCDSVHTLVATIGYPNTGTSQSYACESFYWDGVTYTSSGTYINTYTNVAGCDSVHTLEVILGNSTSTLTDTACDSYLWNGVTYTISGVYTFASPSATLAGCTDTDSLVLTINNSTTSSISVIACDSYDWNGVTYSSTGTYTHVSTNVDGCTNLDVLELTIGNNNSSTSNSISITACDSYDWHGVTYTSSGIYTNTYTNVAGCDSIHILNLIIDYTDIVYDTVSICNGASYGLLNSVYNNAGDYIDSSLNSNGCVSIIHTNLTLELPLISSIIQVGSLLESVVSGGVGSYTYLWNNLAATPDITISSNGSYWLIIMDSLLCPIDTAYYEVINFLPIDISDMGIGDLSIYPNPSKDMFNINFTSVQQQNLKVRVLNIVGEEIIAENSQEFIGKYTKQINLINNAIGIYFLEITTNNGVINKKLILQ